MNEIVYNILRKCVEDPELIEYNHYYGTLKIKGAEVLTIAKSKYVNKYHCLRYSLTDKECRRILSGIEHVNAMKIRNL